MKNSNIVLIDRHPGRSAQTIGIARELGTDPDTDPRAVGRRGRHQGRQPVLPRRHGQGRCDPCAPQGPHRQGAGPAQAAPRPARVHDRDLRRHPQRHARDALFADRPRADQRCTLRAPERDGPCRHDRGRCLRQAAGRARWPRCSSTTSRRSSCRTARSIPAPIPRRARRSTSSAPIRSRDTPTPSYRHRIACHACPGFGSCGGMFTYNTMQTFIGVRRHAAAAHGGAAVRRSAQAQRVPGRAGGPPRQAHGEGPEAARHRRARFHPQRGDRRDGHRRLDQRDAARPRDRARRRLSPTSGRRS